MFYFLLVIGVLLAALSLVASLVCAMENSVTGVLLSICGLVFGALILAGAINMGHDNKNAAYDKARAICAPAKMHAVKLDDSATIVFTCGESPVLHSVSYEG